MTAKAGLGAQDLARLSQLLEQALTLAPEQRQGWLEGLAEPDRAYQPALRRMFAQAGEAESYFAELPRVGTIVDDTEAHPGDVVGAYRLLHELARGGMGSVWLAERIDGALKRQVALKLPHLSWGAGLAERMARERDIAARLEHPNIARLYDAGVDQRGRPFLAFEYIDGVAIDQWCTGQALPVRARLKLFLQVAQAVAHAHARLVVHRDLKPSNVMVTPDGQVHLLDFGIAKLLAEGRPEGDETAGPTQRLGRAMTPHYASPEQLKGQAVTVASDVYSLGVLLYELLTGRRPHEPKRSSLAALEEAVLHGEAPPASRRVRERAVQRALHGDVDAILAKALQRDLGQRYATVEAMAEDIARHLAGEPVRARPATAWYRVGRFVARSRAGLALGAVGAASVAAAAGLSLAQAQQANEAAARAGAVKNFVLDTFRVDAAESRRLGTRGVPREYLLQRGAALIDERFAGQPALQAELHGVVSNLFDEMASFDLAQRHAERRLEVLSESAAPPGEKANAAIALSQALLKIGRAPRAEQLAAQAVSWAGGDPRLAIVARLQLAASLAAQPKARMLGVELDRLDAQIAQVLPPQAIERALALNARASLAAMNGESEVALERARAAVASATAIEGAASHRVLNLRWILWRMLIAQRRVAEARELGASIIADLRQLGGPRDSTAAFAELYYTAFLFANDPQYRLSFDAAEAVILADREIVKQRGCRGIAEAGAWSDYFLGSLYADWHDFDRAEPLLASALARIAPVGDEPMLIPYAPRALAWTRIVRGEHARGDDVLQSQLGLMDRQGSPLAPRTRATLALSLGMQGRHAEALELLGPAPAAAPRELPDLDIALVRSRLLLGSGQPAAALASLPSAEAAAPLAGADLGTRGEALCALGRPAEGRAALEDHLAAEAPRRSPDSPVVARTRAVLGSCALAAGDRARAAELAAQAREALRRQPTVSAYYRQPLERLEGALADRRSGRAQL